MDIRHNSPTHSGRLEMWITDSGRKSMLQA